MATRTAQHHVVTPPVEDGHGGAGFVKALSRFDATALVAGSMIGSAIFIVLGALSYGELAAMFPRTGGLYIYLREGLSPLIGFLYGWALFAACGPQRCCRPC